MKLGNMTRLQAVLLAKPAKASATLRAAVRRVAKLAHCLTVPARSLGRFMAASGVDSPVLWAGCTCAAIVAAMQLAGWLK